MFKVQGSNDLSILEGHIDSSVKLVYQFIIHYMVLEVFKSTRQKGAWQMARGWFFQLALSPSTWPFADNTNWIQSVFGWLSTWPKPKPKLKLQSNSFYSYRNSIEKWASNHLYRIKMSVIYSLEKIGFFLFVRCKCLFKSQHSFCTN